jgi:hypothetical protein
MKNSLVTVTHNRMHSMKIIQEDFNPRKAPAYYLRTERILKEMPRRGIVHLTAIRNAITGKRYFPVQ